MILTVKEKSGYLSLSDVKIVTANDGRFFYAVTAGRKFNLPPGNFRVKGEIEKLPAPIEYPIEIPTAERTIRLPKRFRVKFGPNPNKCSVVLALGYILFDNSFKTYPRFVLRFIIMHERGHFLYSGHGNQSERKCDIYAAARMLQDGYNMSQIKAAQSVALSKGVCTTQRNQDVFNFLLNMQNGNRK